MTRPNVLFIITDQQRADHVGFGGNTVVRTPNLDALAGEGTVFDRAYVANPICMPNRSSILTGRVPSAHGCIFNDRSLPWSANTFVRSLRRSGYQTALIGKSHLQHGMSRNVLVHSDKLPAVGDPYAAGWDAWENPERYLDGPVDVPKDFYGFDHVEFSIAHGDLITGHHLRWALEQGGDPAVLKEKRIQDRPARDRYDGWWQVYQPMVPEELYSTEFVAKRTIEWLEQAAQSDAPWCVQCSFPDPHHPFTPPGKWWDAYDPAAMESSPSFDDPLTDAPAHLHAFRKLDAGRNFVQMFGPTEEQVKHARAAEYGMIEMIDDRIGRVLSALDRLGQTENTIVVFTSDHGDMFGDHGLMLKGLMHYQGCLRVPLVIRSPGRAASRTGSFASSLDLAQTLLELTGVDSFDGMQGESLVPVLDDPKASVRDHVYVEDDFPPASLFPFPIPNKARTLVTDEGRMTRYSSGEVELFDLASDPLELENLANVARASDRRAHMTERLAAALVQYSDTARRDPLPAA